MIHGSKHAIYSLLKLWHPRMRMGGGGVGKELKRSLKCRRAGISLRSMEM